MNKIKSYHIISIIAVPVIIYFWFLRWRTGTIYGDDLFLYIQNSQLGSFWEKVNMSITVGKFRPAYGVVSSIMIDAFQKNLYDYYLFNVGIQAINTLIFAQVLNLFFQSRWISLLLSLLLGLSRFAFYNMTQLINGGALEGLAMTFFLLTLFHLVRLMTRADQTANKKQGAMLMSILFANLAIYTHERYIVLFPFILLVVALSPGIKILSFKQRSAISLLAILSVGINVAIKKWVYSVPFFVGTGGTNISFSFSNAITYFIDGVLSICSVNSKPEYLTGITFFSLHGIYIILPILVFTSLAILLACYLINMKKLATTNEKTTLPAFTLLMVLFVLSLIPAVVTIRLEQRWLQAASAVFILLVAIAFSSIRFRNSRLRNTLLGVFAVISVCVEFNYLHKGGDVIYISSAHRLASYFRNALDNGVIRTSTSKLFFVEQRRDANSENEITWSIDDGRLFEFYGNKKISLIYVDSVYKKSIANDTTLAKFNKNSDQMVCLKDRIIDITNEYIKDSLQHF